MPMPMITLQARQRTLVAALTLACGPVVAHAAGFQLNETSVSGLGSAFASGAAQACCGALMTRPASDCTTARA